jgi:hypothetical protein
MFCCREVTCGGRHGQGLPRGARAGKRAGASGSAMSRERSDGARGSYGAVRRLSLCGLAGCLIVFLCSARRVLVPRLPSLVLTQPDWAVVRGPDCGREARLRSVLRAAGATWHAGRSVTAAGGASKTAVARRDQCFALRAGRCLGRFPVSERSGWRQSQPAPPPWLSPTMAADRPASPGQRRRTPNI